MSKSAFQTESWRAVQQQFIDNFLKLQKEAWHTLTPQEHWQGAFDEVWQTLHKAAELNPGNALSQNLLQQFFQQASQYVQLQEDFLLKVQKAAYFSEAHDLWQSWAEHLQRQFNQVSQSNLLDNWQKLGEQFFLQMQEQVEKLQALQFKLPEDWAQRQAENQALWQSYQRAQQDYVAFFQQVGQQASTLLQARLQASDASGDWRMTYDAWVDAGEEAYAAAINTEAYAEINARVINSLLLWKQNSRELMNELLKALHLPSYSDAQRWQAKIYALQKERSASLAAQQAQWQAQLQAAHTQNEQLSTELLTIKQTSAAEIGRLQEELESSKRHLQQMETQITRLDAVQKALDEAQVQLQAHKTKEKAVRKPASTRNAKSPPVKSS